MGNVKLHNITIVKDGKVVLNEALRNFDAVLDLLNCERFRHLSCSLDGALYYGSKRSFHNDREYVLIYNTIEFNSIFGD